METKADYYKHGKLCYKNMYQDQYNTKCYHMCPLCKTGFPDQILLKEHLDYCKINGEFDEPDVTKLHVLGDNGNPLESK